jgi:hypothetical protein
MKKQSLLIVTAILALLISCGKKSDELKKEKELNTEIMEIHHKQMDVYYQVDSLSALLDAKIADENVGEQAKTAKELLVNFKTMMDEWMEGYEAYDAKAEHAKAIEKLEKDKFDLEKMSFEMHNALKETNEVLK